MEKYINVTIDNIAVSVPENFTIMQAAEKIGINIPRLCYHSKLSQFCGCRVCVVEIEGMKNYPPSCETIVSEGMKIKTNSFNIQKARKNIIELILNNHDQDCKICTKNGICELQRLTELLGIKDSIKDGEKRTYPIDNTSISIVRNPEKCILCGKCVRLCSEIQKVNALTFSYRGFKTKISPAYNTGLGESICVNCGQCINICPTGALIENDSTEYVWNNIHDPNKIVVAQIAPAVRVAVGEGLGFEPGIDLTYEMVSALKLIGFDIVFDTQFSADLTIVEEGSELIHRINNNGKLPMITSCSPGWIKFCETFYPELLLNISSCKSPQQMMGALIKTYYAKKTGIDPAKIFSVSIMPCTAKKFEANRPEMNDSGFRDVDAVLTTRELIKMIKQSGINLHKLNKTEFDSPMGESTGASPIFGITGGVMEAALRTAYEIITGKELQKIDFIQVRGMDGIKEAIISINGMDVRVAVANGLGNTHKLLNEIKENKKIYHFIEIMACPGGCLGGGGQPYVNNGVEPLDKTIYEKRAQALYSIDKNKKIRKSHENPYIKNIYKEFLGEPLGNMSHKLLHTNYQIRLLQCVQIKSKETVDILR